MRKPLVALVVFAAACGGESAPAPAPAVPPPPAATTAPVATAAPPPAPEAPKMTREERNHKNLVAAHAALDAGDIDKHVGFYAADAVKAVPMPDGWKEVKGREELQKQVSAMRALAPDAKGFGLRHFMKGDVGIAEWITAGTHAETKKKFAFRAAGVFWFDDAGLVKQEHVYVDQASLMIQTGRLPGKTRDVVAPAAASDPQLIIAKGDEDKLVDTYKAGWPALFPKKDAKGYSAILTDDFVREPIASPVDMKGKTQAVAEMQALLQAVPDLSVSVDNAWAFSNFVVAETTTKGTQKGLLGILPASHKKISVHGLDIAEYRGDKLARLTTYTNGLELLGQLGLIPKPKDAGAAPKPGDKPAAKAPEKK